MSKLLFHHVFRSQCLVDRSAYFGITSNEDLEFPTKGPFYYLGRGPKLEEKIAKYGAGSFHFMVLHTSSSREEAQRHLDRILAETLSDPLSLNVSEEIRAERISQTTTGQPKEQTHKDSISIAMRGNDHSLGQVFTEESKELIRQKRSKLKWINNPVTKEVRHLEAGLPLPEGFVFGRGPKK